VIDRVTNYLLSLPERVIRSGVALAGGLLQELGDAALPAGVRRTRLYQNLVASTLRFLIEEVGQVEGAFPGADKLAENFATRRAVGNGIELMGILAFRASPVWVLAALADVTGAGRELIRDIAETLKRDGLLDPATEFTTADQILDGLEQTSARLAATINTPPLNADEMRAELRAIRQDAARIPRAALPSVGSLRVSWDRLNQTAAAENRSVFEMSSLVALSSIARLPESVRWLSRVMKTAAARTGQYVGEGLLSHYATTLDDIRRTGYLPYLAREFRPYLRAAASQFSPSRVTLTEKFLKGR
jgi:hypothetical protein